jgi:hypothetical protein
MARMPEKPTFRDKRKTRAGSPPGILSARFFQFLPALALFG